ncbi:unnamed protein product [Rotaria sp. Silwood2]|nr:unnamed protein product [Rotaria sp. Silwood2]
MERILLAADYPNLIQLKLFNFTQEICLNYFINDCLYLLDGRLKRLTTLIIRIRVTSKSPSISHNIDDLPNLKCYRLIDKYDEKILPLLHCTIYQRGTFIDSSHLQNEILLYIPRLHSFTFYISTYENTADLFRYMPSQDIQQIATNIEHQQHIANIINYVSSHEAPIDTGERLMSLLSFVTK